MTISARVPQTEAPAQNLRTAQILTVIILVLATVATAGGLLIPNLYRDNAWIAEQNRGGDLVTLALAVPALMVSLVGVRRGSARATLAWVGLLGYMLYTYVGAAFAYSFNIFFLIYVALFSCSVFALITGLANVDVTALKQKFDAGTPRKSVITFLVVVGLALTAMWLGQIMPFLTAGKLPELIVKGETPTNFVYVMDLGIIVPLSFLSAYLLGRRAPWGYLLSGCVMIKAAAMGLALLSMSLFSWLAGTLTPEGIQLTYIWVVLAVSSLTMSVWFFRHCRG
ncbi:MAG TPA: hypothetical protein VNT75_12575 [Symbiobacteriaceae bacterium]|nr:hypothetical protein [Symbiobacteriaceae bacterium]